MQSRPWTKVSLSVFVGDNGEPLLRKKEPWYRGLEPSPGGLKRSATSFSPLEEEKTCLGRPELPTQFPRNQGQLEDWVGRYMSLPSISNRAWIVIE